MMWKTNEELDLNKSYTIAMQSYTAYGGDDFKFLKNEGVEKISSSEEERKIQDIVLSALK